MNRNPVNKQLRINTSCLLAIASSFPALISLKKPLHDALQSLKIRAKRKVKKETNSMLLP